MATKIQTWLRDWWRGYSDADWEYAKWLHNHPSHHGYVVHLTRGQYKAYVAFQRWIWADWQ